MDELQKMFQEAQGLLVCVSLIVGGLQCFFGYKLFRVMTAILGFIVGGVIGGLIGVAMAGQGGMVVGFLILGIVGALLAYTLYKLGVFVVCFGAGAMVGLMLAMVMDEPDAIPTLMAICGLILGILGVVLTKPVIILSTGIGGGMSMGVALSTLFDEASVGIVLGVVLSVVGVCIQFYLDKQNSGSGSPAAAGAIGRPGSKPAIAVTKDDYTSQQGFYGAVTYGLMGFAFSGCGFALILGFPGVLFTLFEIAMLAAMGAATGGRWNSVGREFFHADEDAFKNSRVACGAAIGAVSGILLGLLAGSGYRSFGVGACLFCACLLFGAIMGYVFEMRRRFKEVYGISVSDAFKSSVAAPVSGSAPAASTSSFYTKPPAVPRAAPAPEPPADREDALVSSSAQLWTQNLPIVFTKTSIIPAAGGPALVSLSLTFQNIGERPVIAVYLGVKCSNLLHQELDPVEKLTIQDFVLEPGKSRTYTYPQALPDSDTRRVELVVRHVVMADDSTWDCEEGRILTALEDQPPLQLEDHLRQQFFKACNEKTGDYAYIVFKSQPQELEGGWRCACGQLNQGKSCVSCGISRADLFECVDRDYLQKSYDLEQEKEAQRREEQKRLEEERQRKLEEERRRLEAAANSTPAQNAAPGPRPMPKPRFCASCGQPLEPVARFCPRCGKAVR